MLQRRLASAAGLNFAPLLASCGSSLCSQLAWSTSSSSSLGTDALHSSVSSTTTSSSSRSHVECTPVCSGRSISTTSSSWQARAARRRQKGAFKAGVWDVQQQQQQEQQHRSRDNQPYFNPEDGPEAYRYWADLWRAPAPRLKRQPPKQLPLYLEKDEQVALCAAAVKAGIPRDVVYGGKKGHRGLPRLIQDVYAHRPTVAYSKWQQQQPSTQQLQHRGVPTDPQVLTERIKQLWSLERPFPGFDLVQVFKSSGFGLLSFPKSDVAAALKALSSQLSAAGVYAAEAGLLFTAAPDMCMHSSKDVVRRAQVLPNILSESLGVSSTVSSSVMTHPYQAQLLRRSSNVVNRHAEALKDSHGTEGAARLAAKLPQLLHFKPKSLDLKTAVLAQGLGLELPQGLDAAKVLVRREPRLLTHSAAVLDQRLQGLRELLGLQNKRFIWVLMKQPSLLHKTTERLADKVSHLQGVLQIPEQKAISLVRQYPQLLTRSAAGLSRPLVCLQQIPADSVLAPAAAKAAEVCLQQPSLLSLAGNKEDSLAARLQLLQDLAGSSPAWQARVAELVAGDQVRLLADVVAHNNMWQRLSWVLQQERGKQQQQQQEEEAQGETAAAAAAAAAARELLPLLQMPVGEFEQQYVGFGAWVKEQQAAARHK